MGKSTKKNHKILQYMPKKTSQQIRRQEFGQYSGHQIGKDIDMQLHVIKT